MFVDVTASTHWASEAIEVAGPAAIFHAGRQPEHGLGDPGGDRRRSGSGPTARSSASPATAAS